MAANVDKKKVLDEVESFKLEYPDYTDEHVDEYMSLLDDFTASEKLLFVRMLGF